MELKRVEYLVVHTAASRQRGVDAETIDRWHRHPDVNFRKIGYHFVIVDDTHPRLADGTIQSGRALNERGAHAKGINSISLGICCAGHGNYRDLTRAQKEALAKLLAELSTRFSVPTAKIIGHRDINKLVDMGIVSDHYRTTKTCPGSLIDMPAIRSKVEAKLRTNNQQMRDAPVRSSMLPDERERLKAGVRLVERHISEAPNAREHWISFRYHPEIKDILDEDL